MTTSAVQDPADEGEGRIPFRVRIGVTGHRRLDDEERTRADIRGCLRQISESFEPTKVTPIGYTVLSALAEGADRLVVGEARDVFGDGAELDAVLPLPVDEYKKDFDPPASIQEFDALLAGAIETTVVAQGGTREEAYERAGRQIVDRSDVLIAIWDRRESLGQGGTADIVTYAWKHGVPVLVVEVRRESDAAVADRDQEPDGDLAAGLAPALDALQRLDRYNRLSVGSSFQPRLNEERERLAKAVAEDPAGSGVARVAEWALPHLVRADLLAGRYQRRHFRRADALLLLAASSVTAAAATWLFAARHPRLAAIEVALMVALVVLFLTGRRHRYQQQWLAYRSLAEAFRSGLFIATTGGRPREQTHDRLALAGRREPWFQRAFSEAWKHRPEYRPDRAAVDTLQRFLVAGWLDDQIDYHRRTAKRYMRRQDRLTLWVYILFGATIVSASLHFAGVGEGSDWPKVFVFLAIMLPAFGAALTGTREQRQYRLHCERSTLTAHRLARLKDQRTSRTGLVSLRTLAAQVHAVIVEENHDWSGVIEFQDLEMVL